jgi:hypothetical protein
MTVDERKGGEAVGFGVVPSFVVNLTIQVFQTH